MNQAASIVTRHAVFLLFCGVGLALFYNPLVQLLRMSFHSELYSHIPMIPLISLCILIFSRKRIFADLSWEWAGSSLFSLWGWRVFLRESDRPVSTKNDYLSLESCPGQFCGS